MPKVVKISDKRIGDGQPAFIIAEIGINHNGDLNIAKQLINNAIRAGCDAVKFQKRTPEICVPPDQQTMMRDTPWGYITYLEYRHKIEFGHEEYRELDQYCRERGMLWFASCWDEPSVDFMEQFELPCLKIPSAALTDKGLLNRTRRSGKPLILSTGMSTIEQIRTAIDVLGTDNLVVCHCSSAYPCPLEELNLKVIQSLYDEFPCPIGYSGHEVGLATSIAAVVLGASLIERHITLDRSMWGSDHAASVEPQGFIKLIKDIRNVEKAIGDGKKVVYESEKPIIRKLRRVDT